MLHALQPLSSEPCAVAIGKFDGVHRGHQDLIHALRNAAAIFSGRSAVVIFETHPEIFFNPVLEHRRLMTLREKIFWLKHYGIDDIYVAPFNASLAHLSPKQFFDGVVERLHVRHWIAGEDMHFGVGRSGNFKTLQSLGNSSGVVIESIISRCEQGTRLGSTTIRNALQMGNFEEALTGLGHDYTISGRVSYGAQRGRQLGFPTANIILRDPKPPLHGVYVIDVTGQGLSNYPAVANIGFRPTLGEGAFVLEAHLLDFSGNLYGARIRVRILKKLRNEYKFTSLNALQAQIAQDVINARHYHDA